MSPDGDGPTAMISPNQTSPNRMPPFGTDLCAAFIDRLPITGASLSVVGDPGHQSTICASDVTAARLEELQFELGEGPHWCALRTGKPALVADVAGADQADWPVFGAAVIQTGARALFSFPLQMGAVTVGVVDLYRSTPGALDERATATAQALAGLVARRALRSAARTAGEEAPTSALLSAEMRREVHQATGMVIAQLDIPATEAFGRLKAHAFGSGRTLDQVAVDVVARQLDFGALEE